MEIPTVLMTTLTRYLNSLKARNTSEHTITAYRTDVRQFFTWLAENEITVTTPQHISRSHIIDYLSHLADQGRSGVTRARKNENRLNSSPVAPPKKPWLNADVRGTASRLAGDNIEGSQALDIIVNLLDAWLPLVTG